MIENFDHGNYIQLSYLQSSGTQYIDTGVPFNNFGKWNLDVQYIDSSVTQINGGYHGLTATTVVALDLGCANSKWFVRMGGSNVNTVSADNNRHLFTMDKANQTVFVDSTSLSITYDSSVFGYSDHIYLFARNGASSSPHVEMYCTEKIYNSKFYDASLNLIHNFIPAKRRSDSTLGMYDTTWDGSVYGCVDMGEVTWTYENSRFHCALSDRSSVNGAIYTSKYPTTKIWGAVDKVIYSAGKDIWLMDTSYGTDIASFKAAMSGTMLYYQRTTDPDFYSPFYTNAGSGTFTAGDEISQDLSVNKSGILCKTANLIDTSKSTLDKYYSATGEETAGIYSTYKFAHTEKIKVNPNTTYTAVRIRNTSMTSLTNGRIIGWDSNKAFTRQIDNVVIATNATGTFSATFTTSATEEYITLNYVYYANGSTDETDLAMIVEGSTVPTEYIPYANVIHSCYKSVILSRSKNLFDKDNVNWIKSSANSFVYILGTSVLTAGTSGSENTRTFYISCKPSTTYTLVFNNAYTKRLGDYPSIPVVGNTVNNFVNNFTDASKTYTTSATANYIVVQLYVDGDYSSGATAADIIPSVMLIEGSSAPTGYIPYIQQLTCYKSKILFI